MYNEIAQETRKIILPTNDVAFKKTFASPQSTLISMGFLKDLANHDPLRVLNIKSLTIETPYNYRDVNQLEAEYDKGTLYTEVDFACMDESGVRFVLEMQMQEEVYLEERIEYNTGEKYGQLYAKDKTSDSKYSELKPVISIVILGKNYFEDDVPIRYLRPHDVRHDLYKKNLNLGLEIYIELKKDPSYLPRNLQLWFEFFRTGSVSKGAPSYLKEAAKMIEKTGFTKEERAVASRIERARMKRWSEDAFQIKKGEKQKAIEIARSLLVSGMPIDEVAQHSGLDASAIENLITE